MTIGATWQCHCNGRRRPEQCVTGFAVNRFRQEVTDVARCRYFLDHQVACCSQFLDPQELVSDYGVASPSLGLHVLSRSNCLTR